MVIEKREDDNPMQIIAVVLGVILLVYGVYSFTMRGGLEPRETLEEQVDNILEVDGSSIVDEISKNKFEVIVEGKVYEVYTADDEIENMTDKYTGEKMYPK